MPTLSAGLLLYRAPDAGVEVLIDRPVLGTQRRWRMVDSEGWIHRGGRSVDRGATRVPRGARQAGPGWVVHPLRAAEQSSGKVFTAFAVSGNLNLEGTFSNTFELEWQRGSERSGFSRNWPCWLVFRGWGAVEAAEGQQPLLDHLFAGARRRRTGRVSIAMTANFMVRGGCCRAGWIPSIADASCPSATCTPGPAIRLRWAVVCRSARWSPSDWGNRRDQQHREDRGHGDARS